VLECPFLKSPSNEHAWKERWRVVVDTSVSEEGMATILRRDKRCRIRGSAHGFFDAGELIRQHRPDILLIEPFFGDRDGIRWIKDLAT
jgi:DNA-binding NarL/FixJ family response regulator